MRTYPKRSSPEKEFDRLLAQGTGHDEEELRKMSLETKREMGDAIVNGGTTNSDTVGYLTSFPIHGGQEPKFNTKTVEYERREPRTYTEEVPIEGGDDPETVTREYKDYGPTPGGVIEWGERAPERRRSELRRLRHPSSGGDQPGETERR